MKKRNKLHRVIGFIPFFLLLFAGIPQQGTAQLLDIKEFSVFGGDGNCPTGPGQTPPFAPGCGVVLGVGSRVFSGHVGSYTLVKTNGDVQVSNNIHSGGTVGFTNGCVVGGRITANNSQSLLTNILTTGSNMLLNGNIDVNGNINIGGGTVSGIVTHPVGSTYNGPAPGGGEVIGAPTLPTMPVMPDITLFQAAGATNISTTQTIGPDEYGNMTLNGKNLTFSQPGEYVFNSIKNTASLNKFIFNFQNSVVGTFKIHVHGDANLGKIQVSFLNGGDASRVFMEVHGSGATNGGSGTYSCIVMPGSDWHGTIWAPFAAIKVGSGSSSAKITGALWSATQVDIEHSVSIFHKTFESPCSGSITIKKEVVGVIPATDWNFTSAQLGNFTLPAAGGTKVFNNLGPGNYIVKEVTKANYIPSTSCAPGPDQVSLDLVNCEDLSCTFINSYAACPCINCDGEVLVTANLTINLNVAIPTVTGTLAPYFSFVKPAGSTADKWKAVFNLGGKRLIVKSPATITVSTVNGYAPGIEINSTCDVLVENGAAIKVISANKNAGDLVINANGLVTVDGNITNQVTGTLGLPGAIGLTSKCADMNISGLVQILGIDGGGNLITLLSCSPCPPYTGDITISGLVKSFAHAHAGDLTLNRPNIRVVSLDGKVVINANTVEPLYDEFSTGGGLYDIYGGLLSWVSDNVNPGTIKVQAKKDVIVNGHGTDPTGPVRNSYGAIASISTASSAPGGFLDIRSLGGKIIGNDRAFDVTGRNRLATNFARILLNAKGNIELNRLGANNNFNPVVSAAGFGAGDNGGKNELRSYSGSVLVGINALVTAAALGTTGANNFTHCTGYVNSGTVSPAATVVVDCTVGAPDALYTNCTDLGAFAVAPNVAEFVSRPAVNIPAKTALLPNYPNPFSQATTISYDLAKPGYVTLKVYDITGKEVAIIVQENQAAGSYQYQWRSSGIPSGVYYARLKAGDFSGVNKLVLNR